MFHKNNLILLCVIIFIVSIYLRYLLRRANTHTNKKYHLKTKIPKIIHQIWIGDKEPPMKWIKTVKDFCSNNGYKYKLWRDTDFNNFSMVNKKEYIAEKTYNGKSDIARYEILYKYGGIYVDADSIILPNRDLNKVFQNINTDFFAAVENPKLNVIATGVIGCRPKSYICKVVIDCIKNNYNFEAKILKLPPFICIGPFMLTEIYNEHNEYFTLLPYYYFYPKYWHSDNTEITLDEINKKYPNSYMFQYGYTTNNLQKKHNNFI